MKLICLGSTAPLKRPLISAKILVYAAVFPKNYITITWLSQVIASKSKSSLYLNCYRRISRMFEPSVYMTSLSFLTIYYECSSNTGIVSLCTEVSIIPLIPRKLKSRNSSKTFRNSFPFLNSIYGPRYALITIKSWLSPYKEVFLS